MKEFHLSHTAISGTLPSELALLTNLSVLYLQNTNIGGTIPEEMYLGLQELDYLIINDCNFTGTISPSVGRWSKLDIFRIHNNGFTGTIPEELGTSSTLRNITLHGNNFSRGTIPEALCSLRAPQKPWELVADCSLDSETGIIPMECSQTCCTRCCERSTGICKDT